MTGRASAICRFLWGLAICFGAGTPYMILKYVVPYFTPLRDLQVVGSTFFVLTVLLFLTLGLYIGAYIGMRLLMKAADLAEKGAILPEARTHPRSRAQIQGRRR